MSGYFNKFPLISYSGFSAVDITRRSDIVPASNESPYTFFPYQVKNAMRPDVVANGYYDDPNYTWLVFLGNKITDPYFQWPLDQNSFYDTLAARYGSVSNAQKKTAFYRVNWYSDDTQLTTQQYNSLLTREKKYWTAVTDEFGGPMTYVRKDLNWTTTTNWTCKTTVANGSVFSVGDFVNYRLGSNVYATATVANIIDNEVTTIHIDGQTSRLVGFTVDTSTPFQANETLTLRAANNAQVFGTSPATVLTSVNNYVVAAFTGDTDLIARIVGNVSGTSANVTAKVTSTLVAEDGANSSIVTSQFVTTVDEDGVTVPVGIHPTEMKYWSKVSMFDVEEERNEFNSTINLIDNRLARKFSDELKVSLNNEL